MLFPWKPPTIDNNATEGGTVSAHEFGQGMHDDISPVIERSQQDRRSNGVVYNQRNAVLVGDVGQGLDIANVPCWIPYTFAEDCSRVLVYRLLDRTAMISLRKFNADPETRQDVSEERISGAV